MSAVPPRATIREVPPAQARNAIGGEPDEVAPPAKAHPSGTPRRWRAAQRSLLRSERASFGYAIEGLRYAWRTQRHLRIHVSLGIVAVGMGLFFSITAPEWAALVTAIALVIALELLNTVVEALVDLFTPEFHSGAKVAKDVAAGAVLVAALGALAVGAAIFLPRIAALVIR